MDCEKFDQHVIDALYGELDELTQAGLDRHVEGCSRCGPVFSGLRATRAVAVLPLEEPPADIEARILAAADLQIRAPWHRKVARAFAWAGAQAARPQIAMAAAFFLIVGSSVFLFRAKSPSAERPSAAAASRPVAAPAPAAADNAAPDEAPSAAATAEAKAPADAVVAERSADAGTADGVSAAAEASAAPDVAAAASVAAAHAAAKPAKSVEEQPAAGGRARAGSAAKPAAPHGGINPRAPAAPSFKDAYH
jgi:hypothetical protein